MRTIDKDVLTIIKSYMEANRFYPQVRFSFVLVLGSKAKNILLETILHGTGPQISFQEISKIRPIIDNFHLNYGVTTIVPISEFKLQKDIIKSVQVAGRIMKQFSLLIENAQSRMELWSSFRKSATNLWRLARLGDISDNYRKFISTPDGGPIAAIRAHTSDSPLAELYLKLRTAASTQAEHAILDALSDEIISTVTILRPVSDNF